LIFNESTSVAVRDPYVGQRSIYTNYRQINFWHFTNKNQRV